MRALYDPSSPRVPAMARSRASTPRRFGPDPAARVARCSAGCTASACRRARRQRSRGSARAPRNARRARSASRSRATSAADGTTSVAAERGAARSPRDRRRHHRRSSACRTRPYLQPRHKVLTRPARSTCRSARTRSRARRRSPTRRTASAVGRRARSARSTRSDPLVKAGLNGTGKTIAIYELAPHTQSDTARVPVVLRAAQHGHAPAPSTAAHPTPIPVAWWKRTSTSRRRPPSPPARRSSRTKDPNSALGSIHVWSAIVNEDKAQSVSTSWGICERYESTSERNAIHALFTQAAAQGQSIFAATGDSGSEDCSARADESTGLAVDSPRERAARDRRRRHVDAPRCRVTKPAHEPVWNDCTGSTGVVLRRGRRRRGRWRRLVGVQEARRGNRLAAGANCTSELPPGTRHRGELGHRRSVLLGRWVEPHRRHEHRVAEAGRHGRRHREGLRRARVGPVQPPGVRARELGRPLRHARCATSPPDRATTT